MFCPKCGKQADESDAFCRSCGNTLSTEKPATAGATPASGGAGMVGVGKAIEPAKRSGEATASLILGLFSFIPIVGLLAVIFGHMARASIRRSGWRLLGDGMAVFGLLLGYLGLGAWMIYGLTIMINPFLPSTRRRENEKLAVLEMRVINTAATTYSTVYDQGYPPSLATLGPPKTGTKENAQAAGLIDEVLASGTKLGYRFTYAAGPAKKYQFHYPERTTYSIDTYTVHADPITPGETGDKHYFIDESGVIRTDWQKEAGAESSPIAD